mmetsp:Transcript_45448/g.110077  ORF Transcript_45448/g.110077 Transcript_45448/m.110077 type:complete len:300 (+) Transcript_45448:447-1346(+)
MRWETNELPALQVTQNYHSAIEEFFVLVERTQSRSNLTRLFLAHINFFAEQLFCIRMSPHLYDLGNTNIQCRNIKSCSLLLLLLFFLLVLLGLLLFLLLGLLLSLILPLISSVCLLSLVRIALWSLTLLWHFHLFRSVEENWGTWSWDCSQLVRQLNVVLRQTSGDDPQPALDVRVASKFISRALLQQQGRHINIRHGHRCTWCEECSSFQMRIDLLQERIEGRFSFGMVGNAHPAGDGCDGYAVRWRRVDDRRMPSQKSIGISIKRIVEPHSTQAAHDGIALGKSGARDQLQRKSRLL